MALAYKTRRRLALLILVVGLPVYIVVVSSIMTMFDAPPPWLGILLYAVFGVLWALPFKTIFQGVGKADPDADPGDQPPR